MPTWMHTLVIDRLPFTVSLELLLIAGRAIMLAGALCVFAWGFSRWRRAQARDAQRVFEQLDLIQGELHGLAETVASLSARMDGLQESLATQAQRTSGPGNAGQRAYENAIRLAQRGATSSDIAAQCGLARHETELLVRLHARGETEGHRTDEGGETSVSTDAPPLRKRLSVVGYN